MAPLRFRCWDPFAQKMGDDITLEVLSELKGLTVRHLNEALAQAQQLGLVVMQSTGLTDKNGKEIYEGDLVKLHWGVRAIAYWQNGFYLGDMTHSNWSPDEVEVIGNIYENPDLLPAA